MNNANVKGMDQNMGNTQSKIDKRKEDARKRKEKQRKIQKARIKPAVRKKILSGICIALVFLLLGGIVFSNSTYARKTFTAVSVGDVKITAAEYSYYYNTAFNNYYSTWTSYGYKIDTSTSLKRQKAMGGTTPLDEYIHDSALSSLQRIVSLSEAAKEAGFTLEEEELEKVTAAMVSLQKSATEYGLNVDELLKASYGSGVTQELYRSIVEREQLANKYYTMIYNEPQFGDSEIEKAFKENMASYQMVDLRYQLFASNEDTAKEGEEIVTKEDALALAEEFMAEVKSEEDFARLSYEIKAATDKSSSEEEADYSSQALYKEAKASSLDGNVAEWAFSEERATSDTNIIENSKGTGYYAVYMVTPTYRHEYNTINVRHILVSVADETDTDSQSTALTNEEANSKITDIYDEWQNGEATEDSFAALAKEYSDDTGSSSNGGLYEQVYKKQMTTEFNDWCFDESRQAGDTEIIKTDYGYHLLYFVGIDVPYWKVQVESDLRSDAYDVFFKELSAQYEVTAHWLGKRLRHEPLPASA